MIQIPMMTQSEQKKIYLLQQCLQDLYQNSPLALILVENILSFREYFIIFSPNQTILYYFQKYASQFAVENKDNIVSIYVHNISVQTILFSQESDRPPSYPGIDTTLASRSSIAASGHSGLEFEKSAIKGRIMCKSIGSISQLET